MTKIKYADRTQSIQTTTMKLEDQQNYRILNMEVLPLSSTKKKNL